MASMLNTGETLRGQYRIDSPLFIGGEATVYEGTDLSSNTHVAIKQMTATPGDANYEAQVKRFRRCGSIRCNSPYVVDAIDCLQENHEVYLVMPFIEGHTLQAILDRNGGRALPPDEAVQVVIEIARGLDALHSNGIVHRDIKPHNIIITPDGRICIVDLGICRVVSDTTITGPNSTLGSITYMAPEQAIDPRNTDERADLYSLGTVFYVLLTGQYPIQGKDETERRWNLENAIPATPRDLNPAVPEHVSLACMKMLAKRPEDRCQTALQFVGEIQTVPMATPGPGKRCASCGRYVNASQSFCGHCGASIQPLGQIPVACLACGMPVDSGPMCQQCHRRFSPCDHRLAFQNRIYRVPEGIYAVGRNELSPGDSCISRRHLMVSCTNGTVHLQDAGSANKTFVNGRPAEPVVQLNPGDEIDIAGHIAKYTHR